MPRIIQNYVECPLARRRQTFQKQKYFLFDVNISPIRQPERGLFHLMSGMKSLASQSVLF